MLERRGRDGWRKGADQGGGRDLGEGGGREYTVKRMTRRTEDEAWSKEACTRALSKKPRS